MQKPTKLQKFFFLTYAAFLLPSIPHIASYFLAFEGNVQGYELWFWVVVSYLIAIAIDGTLLWLTHTVARDTTHKRGYRTIIWLFIFFLVIFSGYLNWHIAKHNAPLASQQLSGAFIPDVDPIVASVFPVLAIMYAVMSRHVFADVKTEQPKSIEELEAEANIAERKATALARINAAKDQEKTSWIKGKIGIVQNALKQDEKVSSEETINEVEEVSPEIHTQETSEETFSSHENEGEKDTQDTPTEFPTIQLVETNKKPARKLSGEASNRIYRILRKNPDAKVEDIAIKAKVSKGYASKIRSQYISEQQENKTKSNGHNTTLDNLELLNIQG